MNEADKNVNPESATKITSTENTSTEKKKISLSDFKVKSFVTKVKVEQMQFLKTAGG